MRRRTFSDRDAQLPLPLGAPRTHAAGVTLVVEPSAHHVEHALRRGAAHATTLVLLESRLVRALLPEVRVAEVAVARVVLRTSTAGLMPPDLLDAMDGALTSLHAAFVDAEHLLRATAKAAPAVVARASMIATAMVAHEQALAELGLIDRRAIAGRLARALATVTDASVLGEALSGATIVELRDFATVPPARLAWLEALHHLLARGGGRVVLHSPTAQGSLLLACGIDDPRERIASTLEARFANEENPPDLLHDTPGSSEGPLSAVATRLFTSSSSSVVEGPIELVVAASARAEAEHAASVAADALSRGVAPEHIVIALPRADEAIMRPLRRALLQRGVPFYEGRGAPPTDTLAIATLLRLLRALDERPRKDLLIDVLRGVPSASRRSLRIRTADALARVAGSDLRRDSAALLASMPDDDTRALAQFWIELLTVPAEPTLARALEHLRTLGEALGFPGALGRHADDVVRTGDPELLVALAHDLSAWASLAATTDELARAVDLAGAGRFCIEWRELAHELELELSARSLVPGHRAGAVSIERLRDRLGLDAAVVILLEAHDGALPLRGTTDPLLSRSLLEALRADDPRRAPPPASLAGAVDLLAAIDAIGRASGRAVVIHRGTDESGRRELPGALALELARITGASPITAHEQPADARVPHDDVAPRAAAERLRARAFAGELLESGAFTGVMDAISPDEAAILGARLGDSPATALSVSAAELILSCPFVVFAERVLRATPKESVDDDGSARELGDLAHRAFLEAYRALAAGESDYARVVRRVLDEAPATSALQRVRRDRLHSDLVATIAIDLTRAEVEGRAFAEGEIPFGDGQAWPALAIEHNGAQVFVRGQIDRVDRAPHGATLIDYKSRRVNGVTTEAFFAQRARGATQIALYSRVVAENLAPRPKRVLARFIAYRDRNVPPTHVGVPKKDDASIWERNVGDAGGGRGSGAIAHALAIEVSAARQGVVPPRRNVRCQHCAQRTACRVPPVVLEERAE